MVNMTTWTFSLLVFPTRIFRAMPNSACTFPPTVKRVIREFAKSERIPASNAKFSEMVVYVAPVSTMSLDSWKSFNSTRATQTPPKCSRGITESLDSAVIVLDLDEGKRMEKGDWSNDSRLKIAWLPTTVTIAIPKKVMKSLLAVPNA